MVLSLSLTILITIIAMLLERPTWDGLLYLLMFNIAVTIGVYGIT